MTDNVTLPGNDEVVATDDVAGVQFQRIKLTLGANGVDGGDVSDANPVPVTVANFPATQPVSLAASPLPAGASTEATLAALKSAVDALSVKIAACDTGAVTLDAATLLALETVSIANFPATQPVSLAASPLPAGASTEATLAALKSAVDALSVKIAACDTGAVTVGNFPAATALTDGQLRAAAVSVSGAFYQATQPVSAAALPLPAGAATESTIAALQTLLTTIAGTIALVDGVASAGSPGQIMLAKRRDADTTTVADGKWNSLNMDEEGRLKVASKPASYIATVGNVTSATSTVPINTERFSNLMIHCTGTFAGANVTFEGSLNSTNGTDGNWFAVQAIRSNANTIETATGVLAAAPAYAWELSVNALKYFRIRATAWTSGTQVWTLVPGTYATEPIPGAQISGTQPVSGTVTATVAAGTINPVVPATPYFVNSAATTNGALVLTGTSNVSSFYATNEGASVAYVKLYNKATAPTVGTDVPEMIIPVPAAASGVPGVANPNIGFHGFRFALGLGIAVTRNAVYTDTTAIGAGEVKVKLSRTV